jgi:hypothetical protein
MATLLGKLGKKSEVESVPILKTLPYIVCGTKSTEHYLFPESVFIVIANL